MDRYWRTRQSIISRMHTLAKLPKELKGKVSLRPEDHLLLISEHGVEYYGESSVKLTSRQMKKKYTAALFFSKNIYQISNNINHKFPGQHEAKNAEIHYSIAVEKSSSYLLREGLISNYPGMNVIDTISLSEVIESEMRPHKNDIFGILTDEELRDSISKSDTENRLAEFLQNTLSKFGMTLVGDVIVRWSETSSEALESFKSARLAEIEAKEELMKIEKETNLSAVQLEAQALAQKKLKKSRRHLAKKEREFLQNQLENNHQMKVERLELEKETFRLKKIHEIDFLRAKMRNELSEIELEMIVNERFADEEKRIALEQDKMNANFDHRTREMELFFEQQRMELELDKEKADNIENKRILGDFERDENLKTAQVEAEIQRIQNDSKMEQLKQLIELKNLMNQKKNSGQSNDENKQDSDQEISGNIIGGNLNVDLTKKSSESKQKISDNVISGDVNLSSKSEED